MPALRGVPGRPRQCRGAEITARRRNRHRGSTGAHHRQQLHVPPHPHGSTTATKGARKCTLDSRYLCTRPLNEAQPLPRVHRNTPSTAISTPSTQPSNDNPPRRHTKTHPQQQIDPHPATQQNPTATEGAQECTLDQIPPLRPLLRHPTATEGTALRTLDSNYTSQPTCTATQPSSREHLTAHSTADGPHQATQQNPTATEGAQEYTLNRIHPHSCRHSITQLPPKVQHCAPSTAIARPNPPARQHNRRRGCTTPHPQHRLGLQTPSPATANRPEGTQKRTLDQEHPAPTATSTAQPPTRAQGSAPSTAISAPNTPPSNTTLPRGCTTVNPRPGLPLLRPLFRHPTATKGAALCALNSSCTTQPTHTAAQTPPRAHNNAPSVRITYPGTGYCRHNPPRGSTIAHPGGRRCSIAHPRPQIAQR